MHLPIRAVRGGWPNWIEQRIRRFTWADPSILLSHSVTPQQFREVMSAIHVGQTIKITGADRHGAADELVTTHLDLSGATIVDIGASDGSTSVELINKLDDFEHYVIADLYLSISAVHDSGRTFFFDPEGNCILVAGRHLVAWPSISEFVSRLYAPLIRRASQRDERQEVLLLNPSTRRLMDNDERVTAQVHDVFDVWDGKPPNLIKVANLLRRLYFSDEQILAALAALHRSLATGGHLLVVDNPRIKGLDIRAGLFRRAETRFEVVATTAHEPEIADLISRFDTGESLQNAASGNQ